MSLYKLSEKNHNLLQKTPSNKRNHPERMHFLANVPCWEWVKCNMFMSSIHNALDELSRCSFVSPGTVQTVSFHSTAFHVSCCQNNCFFVISWFRCRCVRVTSTRLLTRNCNVCHSVSRSAMIHWKTFYLGTCSKCKFPVIITLWASKVFFNGFSEGLLLI